MLSNNLSQSLLSSIFSSLKNREGNVNSTDDLLSWIKLLNNTTEVLIKQTNISEDSFWFYDDHKGEILNRKRSFFSIIGVRQFINDEFITEQPIIIQNEIGYLGIIAKEIDGVLNFLMQAKIEPGNVNCVQISPTIQATKSNFMRTHGGKLPLYFEWFEKAQLNGGGGTVIYDQIQSEQGSRFLGKRNRNIIFLTNKDVPLHPNYKWMTLGQIKSLMKIDNLVNMDTRTVLSGLPILDENNNQSIDNSDYISAYSLLNNWKMYHDVHRVVVPLNELIDWKITNEGVTCKHNADFCVRYYDIKIQNREVQRWTQPLLKATTNALFVLFTKIDKGIRKFLISLAPEIGCFDKVEYAPSIQLSDSKKLNKNNMLHKIFLKYINSKQNVLVDVMLSEEGGRFYHEQNRNVIIEINDNDLIPNNDSLWVDINTLNLLISNNNVLNIQLRNLISLYDS